MSDTKGNFVKEQPASFKRKLTFKEQHEYAEIEAVIASAEGELSVVAQQINVAGADYGKLNELTKTQLLLQTKLDELMARWAYLEDIAEQQK